MHLVYRNMRKHAQDEHSSSPKRISGTLKKLAEEILCKTSSDSHGSFLGLEAGEVADLDVLNEGVEFTLGVLVLVSAAGDANTDLAGHVSDTVGPDESVKSGVDTDVLGEHLLGGESLDVTNAAGSALLELDSLEHLVHVEGVVAAGGLHLSLGHLVI